MDTTNSDNKPNLEGTTNLVVIDAPNIEEAYKEAVVDNKPAPLVCRMCGLNADIFSSKQNFERHERVCRGEESRKITIKHIQIRARAAKENPARTHTCEICHKTFSSGGALGGHMNTHKADKETIPNACPRCSRRADSFKWKKSFKLHLKNCIADAQGKCKCAECGEEFANQNALNGHKWIHEKIEPGREWGDKDEVRMGLQKIASVYLRKIPLENRLAICLPGDRPDKETKLLSFTGFAKIYMAEIDEATAKASQDAGFDVQNEDFLDLAAKLVDEGKKLAMIDYDVCGTVSYAEGSALINLIRRRGIADVVCIRITTCRRHFRHNLPEAGIEAFGRDLEANLPKNFYVVSRASSIYVGKERSSMMVEQWILKKAT